MYRYSTRHADVVCRAIATLHTAQWCYVTRVIHVTRHGLCCTMLLRNTCYTVVGLAWCMHSVTHTLRNTQWTRDAGTDFAPPRARPWAGAVKQDIRR